MKSLGSTLKKARELKSLTLRQVEEATGISNAYLSQLENDKIKKPSANVLYKLAKIYKLELSSLLSASGIIEESHSTNQNALSDLEKRIAFYAGELSDEQRKQVLEYIEFLKFKR